ncbi:MAG: Manganese catalase [uncultured Frankineae bacterium]|uniref:Manganese catalase n=1 Tax=uncultured Frankineae bacterium TaxID=437475 RepID=A0A6J4KPA7_9ACTN|nr:MAG: Manganese catalase [uncultured Frankineae bacterium]
MFFHRQELQFKAQPSAPDAVFARSLQEVLGGQYGEITVAMQYAFQGWNMHIPGKYRDLVFGIAAEEFGHVEMLAVMIAQLLEKQPLGVSGNALQDDPTVAAVLGGMDRQHAIVAGAGARAVDSNGNPWQGSFITASGNLMADFHANANAEMQGRLQVARLIHMTDDHGVRDMLKFLLARDTMHQNQWLAAIEELKEDGLELLPVPSNYGQAQDSPQEVSYQYQNFSDGAHAAEGRWASGPTPDGNGTFSYSDGPTTTAEMPPPTHPDARLFGTTELPSTVERLATKAQDLLNRE